MKKASLKKVLKKAKNTVTDVHANADVKRYIGAVSKDFKHQVSAVAEQFGGLNKKIDVLTEEMGGMKEDIEIIKSNVEIIKSDLNRKVDYSEFAALEKRVRLVETKLHR